MSYHSVNSCKNIVWIDGNSTSHHITKVVYCDNYGTPHTIWPCRAELTYVYFVDLTSNVTYPYTYDTNTHSASPRLIPGHNYAIKGTINIYGSESGSVETTLTDCYFFHETLERTEGDNDPISLHWFTGDNSSAGYSNMYPKANGTAMSTSHGYNVYRIDDYSVGDIRGYSIQLGFYDDDSYGFYTQNGFIFDTNYQTPIILKRISLSESIAVYDSNESTTVGAINMHVGDSAIIIPKTRVAGDNYTGNWTTSDNWTWVTGSWYTVTSEGNGQYEITLTGQPPSTPVIQFTSPSGSSTLNQYIAVTPDYHYRAGINGDYTSTSKTITDDTAITVKRWPFDDGDDYTNETTAPTSSYSISSSNTSVISIINNNTMHIVGDSGQSATITVTADGNTIKEYTITIGIITVSWKGSSDSSNSTLSTSNNGNTYWNWNSQEMYQIDFTRDVYINIGSGWTIGGATIYATLGNSDVNGYTKSLHLAKSGNAPTNGSTYNIDVYNSQGGSLLGTIVLHINS